MKMDKQIEIEENIISSYLKLSDIWIDDALRECRDECQEKLDRANYVLENWDYNKRSVVLEKWDEGRRNIWEERKESLDRKLKKYEDGDAFRSAFKATTYLRKWNEQGETARNPIMDLVRDNILMETPRLCALRKWIGEHNSFTKDRTDSTSWRSTAYPSKQAKANMEQGKTFKRVFSLWGIPEYIYDEAKNVEIGVPSMEDPDKFEIPEQIWQGMVVYGLVPDYSIEK